MSEGQGMKVLGTTALSHRRNDAVKGSFNHGWTQMNTDEEEFF
jgi:hypothetical protein